MYWASLEHSYEQLRGLGTKLQIQAGLAADYNEGVAAFREKRAARFLGGETGHVGRRDTGPNLSRRRTLGPNRIARIDTRELS
jgi:hypothetical protein